MHFTSAKAEDASSVCAAPAVKAAFQAVCSISPRVCPCLLSGLAAMRVVTADDACEVREVWLQKKTCQHAAARYRARGRVRTTRGWEWRGVAKPTGWSIE